MRVTLDLFPFFEDKLAIGGALLLFQAGAKPDNPKILIQADEYGWQCVYALTWLKQSVAPTKLEEPYAPASERLLVFCRKGDKLQWHSQHQDRSDVIKIPSITQKASTKMELGKIPQRSIHLFQKTAELAKFLIEKHTFEGELVVDPFGCSGWSSIEAINLDRKWMYIESNQENFTWGQQRINAALHSKHGDPSR